MAILPCGHKCAECLVLLTAGVSQLCLMCRVPFEGSVRVLDN